MKNKEQPDLSLILALYNEGPVLKKGLERIFEALDKSDLSYEIILIDDRSKDVTFNIAKESITGRDNCCLYQHENNIGRGGTVTEGFQLAKGRVIGFIDVDLEAGPEYISSFVQKILNGEADVITGLRKYKVGFSTLIRFISSRFYQFLVRHLLKLPFKDTETGYKFFLREKILPVLNKVKDKGWFWDTEIMARSFTAGLKIKELPVIFKKNPKKKSTVKIFRDSIDYFVKLIKFSREFRKK